LDRVSSFIAHFREKELSVLNTDRNKSIQIIPNPANNITNIYLQLDKSSNISITLTNMLGINLMNIYEGFAEEGIFSKEVSLSDLSSGVYFIRVWTENGHMVEKIVVE